MIKINIQFIHFLNSFYRLKFAQIDKIFDSDYLIKVLDFET